MRLGVLIVFSLGIACRNEQPVATKEKGVPPVSSTKTELGDPAYFPLVAGAKYEYDAVFGEKRTHEVRVVRAADLAIGRVFYFVDAQEAENHNPIIGSNSFGLGAYRVSNEGIETGEAFWREDLARLSPTAMHFVVRFPLVKGATNTVTTARRLELTVVGPETLTVPAGTYPCMRLDQREIWPDKTYEGSVWLSRGVGVVKRIYTTGRTEVLTRFQVP